MYPDGVFTGRLRTVHFWASVYVFLIFLMGAAFGYSTVETEKGTALQAQGVRTVGLLRHVTAMAPRVRGAHRGSGALHGEYVRRAGTSLCPAMNSFACAAGPRFWGNGATASPEGLPCPSGRRPRDTYVRQ